MDDFLQKLKKVVRIALYRSAIGQSDCRKPVRISCHVIIKWKSPLSGDENDLKCFVYLFQRNKIFFGKKKRNFYRALPPKIEVDLIPEHFSNIDGVFYLSEQCLKMPKMSFLTPLTSVSFPYNSDFLACKIISDEDYTLKV